MKTRNKAQQLAILMPPLQFAKTKLAMLQRIIILAIAMTTAPAFGQFVWNGALDGTNIDVGGNYVGGVLPNAGAGEMAMFDGTLPGDLNLHYVGNWQSGFGQTGLELYIAGTQTGAVSIANRGANNNPPNCAINNITIDPGAGPFSLAEGTRRFNYAGRPAGAVHTLVNNSANTATIGPQLMMIAGGGTSFTFAFGGTGNWQVNSYTTINNDAAQLTFQVDGPGTTTWNPSGLIGVNGIAAINVNGGKLAITNLHPRFGNQPITINGTLELNFPAPGVNFTGPVTGFSPGTLNVTGGTVTLSSGASTFSGTNLLSGGELIVNGIENPGVSGPLGLGSTISFVGGTLRYSANNVFDYSSSFDTSPGQAYRINTAGQTVVFTNAAGLSGAGNTLTKLGAGTLTLAGPSTYTGLTTVSGGKLAFQGSKTGTGNITVADGAALDIFATGTPVTPSTLTVGTASGATLEFDNVNSTVTAPLAAGTLSSVGTITINVNSGTLAVGQTYPLFSWTTGSAPAVSLGIVNGFVGSLSTNLNTIRLTITAENYKWTGINNGSWDLTTANNWVLGGAPVVFANGVPAFFDDTASGNTNLTITGALSPSSVAFNNANLNYSIASSTGNSIGSGATLTKSGSGTVTLSGGANTYTGVTAINNGVLSVGMLANGNTASDIGAADASAANLVLNGGTLQYTGGGASVDRSFTVGLAGGTIDASGSGALNLTAASIGYAASGARTIMLTGTNAASLAASVVDSGGATALAKNGAGTWVLTGTNTYSGLTAISAGVLQIGAGGTSGSLDSPINNGAVLAFNRSDALTVTGSISGSGSVRNDGAGTSILAANNTYAGATTINAGAVQFGTGGASGTVAANGYAINTNATLIFNTTTPLDLSGGINGAGNLVVRTGFVKAKGGAIHTGWTQIDPGATFQPAEGLQPAMQTSGITNNGTLKVAAQNLNPATFAISNNIVGTGQVVIDTQNQNPGWLQLSGTNTYSGGTFLAGGGLVLGDGITPGAGTIVGSIVFTNTSGPTVEWFAPSRRVVLNRPDNFTFTNDLISTAITDGSAAAHLGSLQQNGPGVVTLTKNYAYGGGTETSFGATLQVGDGGTTGNIGAGAIVNNGVFIFNRSDDVTLSQAISGAGNLVKEGAGSLTISGATTYTGQTIVSNGTLVVVSGNIGDLFLEGGTYIGGGLNSVITNNVTGAIYMNSGTLVATLNKSLAESNTVYSVAGFYVQGSASATLRLVNAGPDLAPGDTFTIFTAGGLPLAVTSGELLTIIPPAGVTVTNKLHVDGSITVLTSTPTAPPTLNVAQVGNDLQFTWSGSFKLQAQTNSLSVGLSNNWGDYPGGGTSGVTVPVNVANGSVFFRLVSTP